MNIFAYRIYDMWYLEMARKDAICLLADRTSLTEKACMDFMLINPTLEQINVYIESHRPW